MRASLLPNGHVVGTRKASRQSLSQSPVLGRHGNKQRGAREMGDRARERHASARLSLIQLHAAAMTPSSMDTLCASQTSGLTPCSAALFLSHRQAPPPLIQTHTQPHTASHTLTHSSHTPHSPTLTHTYSSHTLIHHLNTPHTLHKHIHTHIHPHTYTPSHTHTHTLFIPSHTHTLNTLLICTHTHTHTHTQSQSLQERRHRIHRDPGSVLTHQARGACGNSPESQLSSVTGPSTYWEPLGLLEAP